jgi:hypothetical protein
MPIEDIQYLNENSEKDNFILYVDSTLRNQNFYPRPNQYTVSFEQPFKFVYGIDILDAAIPATMYNVEEDANDVCGATYILNPDTKAQGYDFQKLLNELSEFDDFDRLFYSKTIAQQLLISGGTDSRITGQIVVTNNALLDQWAPYANNGNTLATSTEPYYYVFVREEITSLEIYLKSDDHLFVVPVWEFEWKGEIYQIGDDFGNVKVQVFKSLWNSGEFQFIFTKKGVKSSFPHLFFSM